MIITSHLFTLLAGTWTGEGRGQYPTVTSFDYRETLTFTRRDEKTLAYEQRTQKRYDSQTEWLESHWENGFIRILENSELELTSAQIGRTEVLVGKIETQGTLTRIHFVSKTITNDPRMVSSARRFELEGDSLRYEMEMHTTAVDRLTPHLKSHYNRSDNIFEKESPYANARSQPRCHHCCQDGTLPRFLWRSAWV